MEAGFSRLFEVAWSATFCGTWASLQWLHSMATKRIHQSWRKDYGGIGNLLSLLKKVILEDYKLHNNWIVMGHEHNLNESSMNVISLLNICVKREIHEWQSSPFFVILSEKLVNFTWNCLNWGVNSYSQHKTEVKHDSVKYFHAWIFHEHESTDLTASDILAA